METTHKISHALPLTDLKVGQTYPMFGIITRFIREVVGDVVVEINNSITLSMTISTTEALELLKSRAFDPGIFMSQVTATEPTVIATCDKVVFGKRPLHTHTH